MGSLASASTASKYKRLSVYYIQQSLSPLPSVTSLMYCMIFAYIQHTPPSIIVVWPHQSASPFLLPSLSSTCAELAYTMTKEEGYVMKWMVYNIWRLNGYEGVWATPVLPRLYINATKRSERLRALSCPGFCLLYNKTGNKKRSTSPSRIRSSRTCIIQVITDDIEEQPNDKSLR